MGQVIDGILFDKDGTLIDFDQTWGRWLSTFLLQLVDQKEELALPMADALGFELTTSTFASDSVVIAGTPDQAVDLLLPFLPAWDRDALLDHANLSAAGADLAEIVPTAALLDQLRADGIALGIATNDAEQSAISHMTKLGIADRFDAILGFDSGYGCKPDPDMLLAFARAVDLPPAQIAMVGDSLHDLHAGQAAGMICIGVLSGPAGVEELAPFSEVVLKDISELSSWIERHKNR